MNLDRFVPTIYQKSVLDIDYTKLKKTGIKCILFDLDNTLINAKENSFDKKIEKLLVKLSKDFKLIIVSNNFKKRIKPFCDIISIDFISFCLKPCTIKLKRKLKKLVFLNDEICIIGDQLISDVLVGNKIKVKTILVDPIGKDLKVTGLNRYLENRILNKLKDKNALERGNYYE
ncbi:MAG: HAD hydrolase-like protein [Bacilli bacterium]|nr:HAD hydrolase-like protein [Bacilli bacterium]